MKKLLCALIAAGLVSAAAITTVAHAAPALADTITYSNLGYPWVAAHCATPDSLTHECDTVASDNWGYTSCPSNDTNCRAKVLNGYGVYDPWNYYLRNCTGFVAWKLASLGVNLKYFEGLGDGGSWYDSAKKKGLVSVGTTPQVGAAAVAPGGDHVAYVSGYDKSTGVITVEEYNHDEKGDGDTWTGLPSVRGFTEYVYFASKMPSPPPSGGASRLQTVGVGSTSDGRTQVFAVGTSTSGSDMYVNTEAAPGSSSWSGWQDIGGTWPSGDAIGVGSTSDGRTQVFAVGSSTSGSDMYVNTEAAPGSSSWSDWQDLGGTWPA